MTNGSSYWFRSVILFHLNKFFDWQRLILKKTLSLALLFSLFGVEAVNVLQTCSDSSACYANALVNLKIPMLDNMNCIGLASLSEFHDFIAHQRCKDVTNMLWAGQFDVHTTWFNTKVNWISIDCSMIRHDKSSMNIYHPSIFFRSCCRFSVHSWYWPLMNENKMFLTSKDYAGNTAGMS